MTTEKPDRPVILWDCDEDAVSLHYETKKEAIESFLDDTPLEDQGETITVFGYARMIVPQPDEANAESLVEEEFLGGLWEEYIGEDGPDITARMNEAALAFLTVLHEEFVPWACEQVSSEKINVAEWIAENRPDWLEQPK